MEHWQTLSRGHYSNFCLWWLSRVSTVYQTFLFSCSKITACLYREIDYICTAPFYIFSFVLSLFGEVSKFWTLTTGQGTQLCFKVGYLTDVLRSILVVAFSVNECIFYFIGHRHVGLIELIGETHIRVTLSNNLHTVCASTRIVDVYCSIRVHFLPQLNHPCCSLHHVPQFCSQSLTCM